MTDLNKPESMLDRLYMAAPCSVGWDNMQGNDRVRFCNVCSKNVYNISEMTKSEAEGFLNEYGITVCMRMYQRADGTIINDNCPVGLRKLRNGARILWRCVASFVGLCLSISNVFAQTEKASESKTPLPPMSVQMVDGTPGIRECEKLPSFEVLTTGKHSLKVDDEILIRKGGISLVISKPVKSTVQGKSTASYYDLWDQFTANKALVKAREFADQGDLKTANSFYKLLMKYFESFDVYKSSEKELAIKEYVKFLERWKKPKESAALQKEMNALLKRQIKAPDVPDAELQF